MSSSTAFSPSDKSPASWHLEVDRTQPLENHNEPQIDLGNAAVLLDVKAGHIENGDYGSLRLAKDGHTILIPQPSDDPNDPLNWPSWKKHMILITIGIAAALGDFTSTLGIPLVLLQSKEWHMNPNAVNYANSLNVLMLGIGGIFWVPFVYFWGRAPVLFWTTLAGTLFTMGICITRDFPTFYVLRALQGFTLSSVQGIGLAFIKDMFFFHEHARKIGIWGTIFLTSPYLGPPFGNYIISGTGWYAGVWWLAFGTCCLDLVLIVLFADETWYNRSVPRSEQPLRGSRLLRTVGIWQIFVKKGYFLSSADSYRNLWRIFTQPIMLLCMIYYGMSFMWAVGINIETSILFTIPKSEGGYGFNGKTLGTICLTPAIAINVGEAFGHVFNDYIANRYIRKHEGVFVPEARLVANYVGAFFMIPGLLLIGQSLQYTLQYGAVIMGWGMYVFGVMVASVAITTYCLDAYPAGSGEVNCFLNFARTIGGFSVAYFQEPWGAKVGFGASFGTQAAVVAAALLILGSLQKFGPRLRQ